MGNMTNMRNVIISPTREGFVIKARILSLLQGPPLADRFWCMAVTKGVTIIPCAETYLRGRAE